MILLLLAAVVAQPGDPSLCAPSAVLEANAAGSWTEATVIERRQSECVVRLTYAGVEKIWYLTFDKLRAGPSAAQARQQARSRNLSAEVGGNVVRATPEQIYDDFNRDYTAAAAKYFDHRILLTGAPAKIQDGRLYFFRLGFDLAATCDIADQARSATASVTIGRPVTVSGYAQGTAGRYTLSLDRCVIEKVANVRPMGRPATLSRPPLGRYFCTNAGRGVGSLTLTAGNYTVGGVAGSYRYDPASGRFTFTSGSYATWGWSGTWRTDARSPESPLEPRIELTDGKALSVRCYPAS